MSRQVIGLTTLKSIVFNGNSEIDRLVLNDKLIWEKNTSTELLNFTGIDAMGRLETDYGYDGNPVEYAVGKGTFIYYYHKYTQATTPADIDGYNGKYVYNKFSTFGNPYSICSVKTETDGTKTIYPSWVLVGTTLVYTKDDVQYSFEEPQSDILYGLDKVGVTYEITNGINQELYRDIDLSASYNSSMYIPDLGITEIIIPETYNGKPVTQILEDAFYSYTPGEVQNNYYVCYNLQSLKLGNNIKMLSKGSLRGVTKGKDSNSKGLILNDCLEDIGYMSLMDCLGTSIDLPASVKTMAGYAVGWSSVSNQIKLTVRSNITYKTSRSYNGLYDYVGTVIFEQSVTEVTGNILYSPEGQNKTTTLVFKHSKSDFINIDVTAPRGATTLTIYTDNDMVKNYDWAGKNFTVTFKNLSEYVE